MVTIQNLSIGARGTARHPGYNCSYWRHLLALLALATPSFSFAQAPTLDQEAQPSEPAPTASAMPAEGISSETLVAPNCFPRCRTGFLCYEGQCVSGCNPPCPSTETCTADYECVPTPRPYQSAINTQPLPTTPEKSEVEIVESARLQEIENREEVRRPWRVFIGAALGIEDVGFLRPVILKSDSLAISPLASVGIRNDFDRLFSYQVRLNLSYMNGTFTNETANFAPNAPGSNKVTENIIGIGADTTLRVGPTTWALPWFVGAGPLMQVDIVLNKTKQTIPYVGGVAETGILFGASNQFELSFRFKLHFDASDQPATAARLFFAFAI